MRIFVYILIAVVAVLVLLCYSLCAIASEADGKENEMDAITTAVERSRR